MSSSIIEMLCTVFGAGVVGGALNALFTDNGFIFPTTKDGVLRPGFVGNVFTGGVGALVSWGLYTASAFTLFGDAGSTNPPSLTLGSLAGAVLVGIGGARWLSNEVDKTMLHAAAVEIARRQPSAQLSDAVAKGSPSQILNTARSM
jgi:hypothetical protein